MTRVAAAVVAAGAVAAIVLIFVIDRNPGTGPFGQPNDVGWSWVTGDFRPGQIDEVGLPLTPGMNQPVTILAVHPLPTDDVTGVRLRYAASTGRILHRMGGGWRPKKWQLRSLPFVIPAHTEGGVVIGASARKLGVYFIHGFVVDYEIDGTRYSAPQHFGMKLRVTPNGLRVRGR